MTAPCYDYSYEKQEFKQYTYTYLNSEYRGPQLQLWRQKCPIRGSTMESAAQLPTWGQESCLLYK